MIGNLLKHTLTIFWERENNLNEEEYDEELPEEELEPQVIVQPDFRVTALYGDVDTKNAREILASFLVMKEPDLDVETGELVHHPFDFYISTPGGHAGDMFAIYDLMRIVRTETDICTIGLGKVMSAGVLLLAAGTKGMRKIGENCRVMIHAANSSYYGSVNSAGAQLEEVRELESMLVKALAKETKMTTSQLWNIIEPGTNHYLSAKEAVKLGIADIIV